MWGRFALWPKCGLNKLEPLVSGNLTALRKEVLQYRKQLRKDKVEHVITLQKLTIKEPSKSDLIEMIRSEDTTDLIRSIETLNRWEWKPNE
jgi:hypothetical protein